MIRRPAILFGAGVSVAPPSALPTAWTLLATCRDQLASALQHRPELLAQLPPLERWTGELRFEEVMSIFDLVGLGLEAVAPLDVSREPNGNHRALAGAYLAGLPLLTTNFDILTELAILQAGGALDQVVHADGYRASDPVGGRGRLYKLHGTFWSWDGARWVDARESIRATFESIGAQYARYRSNDAQKVLLSRIIQDHPLIVVGYSGSDDFDIAPMVLEAPREQPLVWVQHDVRGEGPLRASSLAEVPEAMRQLIPAGLFRPGHRHPVTWVCDDTTAFLRGLAEAPGSIPRTVPVPGTGELARNMFSSEWQACAFAGKLLVELGPPLDAVPFLEQAREAALAAGEAERACMAEYDAARAYRAAGDDQAAADRLSRTLELAAGSDARKLEASSVHFLGRLVARRSPAEAEERFRAALALTDPAVDPVMYGAIVADLGEVLWKRGASMEAFELLVRGATILEATGELQELASVEHALAIWAAEARRLREARAYTRSSLELHERLGLVKARGRFLHELGIIEGRCGNAEAAERRFQEALQHAADFDDPLGRAVAMYHLGWLAYQRHDLDRAHAFERESTAILRAAELDYFFAHNLQLQAVIGLYRGHIADGRRALETAAQISRRVGDEVHVRNCRELLAQLDHVQPPEGSPFVVATVS